ncbi:MAG: hypothetical protein ACHBN1_35675 [Heteroscytonema crispum UTEX LB 1556]
MSPNPLLDSASQPSKTSGLKPVLSAALASLEVQLDQELARYRRTRTGSRTASQKSVGSYIGSQSQLIALATRELKTQPAPESPGSVSYREELSLPAIKSNISPASAPETPQESPVSVTAKTEQTQTLKVPPPPPETAKTQTAPTAPTPKSGSIVPITVVKAQKTENVQKNENLIEQDDSPKQPDDYLESSEALLRSLTEEQPQTTRSNSGDRLLSPLGIGSILLLLVASLTLGYVMFNQKSLSQLNLAGLFKGNYDTSAEKTEATQPETPATPIAKYPNLANEEFPEVNSPNDVVGLKPKAKPTPTALPSTVAAQNPANPATQVQQVQPLQSVTSLPSPTATTPPKPAAPQNLDAVKPSADGFYHIIADNQSGTFAFARQVVPDAYLSPDGKFVYLGALKTKEQVKQQLQLLQAKGIKARLEQP